MSYKVNHRSSMFRPLISLAFLAAVSACGDFETKLPGEYSLVRNNADEIIIVRRLAPTEVKVVIGPRVSGYRVFSNIVVGQVVLPDDPALRKESTPGYFVIDTTSHEVAQGMEKAEWARQIKGRGLPDDPALPRPSWWSEHQ